MTNDLQLTAAEIQIIREALDWGIEISATNKGDGPFSLEWNASARELLKTLDTFKAMDAEDAEIRAADVAEAEANHLFEPFPRSLCPDCGATDGEEGTVCDVCKRGVVGAHTVDAAIAKQAARTFLATDPNLDAAGFVEYTRLMPFENRRLAAAAAYLDVPVHLFTSHFSMPVAVLIRDMGNLDVAEAVARFAVTVQNIQKGGE